MHDACLAKIRKVLEKHHKTEIEFELVPWVNLETGHSGTDLPPLYYNYREGKKRKRANVHLPFCPFCGVKMDEEKDNKPS
jgi:hypothetical protein